VATKSRRSDAFGLSHRMRRHAGQIWDVYEDAAFLPEELPQLRSECLQVKSETTQPQAAKALRKSIYACDEAAERGYCLLLTGDQTADRDLPRSHLVAIERRCQLHVTRVICKPTS
jgi:hypothetical protein